MATQTYAPTNAVTIPSHTPSDNGGSLIEGTLTSGVGGNEDNYLVSKNAGTEMMAEIQDFISIYCRATTTGLALTPRAALLKVKMIIDDMLRQPNYG